MEWHRAMVPGTDRDATRVKLLRNVMRMHAIDHKADDATFPFGGRPDDSHSLDLSESGIGACAKFAFVCFDAIQPQ